MTSIGFARQNSGKSKERAIPLQDFRHVLITGETGSGKTASIIFPTLKDRIATNNAIVFLEYKGHEHKKVKALALKENRLDDVVEFGKPTGAFFNMMAMFDSNMLRMAIIRLCGREDKDSYWSIAAAQLAVRVIDLQRKLYNLGLSLHDHLNVDKNIFTIHLTEGKTSEYTTVRVDEEPSFFTLAKIVSTPSSLMRFFSSFRMVLRNIDTEIHQQIKNLNNTEISNKFEKIISEFLILNDLLDKYENFKIEDSDEAGGNNGVLQILNNAIATLSTLDYINKNEVDVLQLIEKNAIIIVDVQSIDSGVYSLFLESLLKKLSNRLKFQIPNSVSFFLDEANRVLSKNIDLHNDVLREANVELILAIQNEEQMELKFGEVKWESMVKNLRQKYHVNTSHKVSYNNGEYKKVNPLLLKKDELEVAEYAYNELVKNRQYIEKRFMLEENLPKNFSVILDLDTFMQYGYLQICSSAGETNPIFYVGEAVKHQTKLKVDSYLSGELEEELIFEEEICI